MRSGDGRSWRKWSRSRPAPVVCVETGERFESRKDAAEWVGVYDTSIGSAIRFKYRAGGYHWRHAPDYVPRTTRGHKRKTPVVCIDTGQRFDGVAEAAASVGRGSAAISNAIRMGMKSAGLRWEYA